MSLDLSPILVEQIKNYNFILEDANEVYSFNFNSAQNLKRILILSQGGNLSIALNTNDPIRIGPFSSYEINLLNPNKHYVLRLSSDKSNDTVQVAVFS